MRWGALSKAQQERVLDPLYTRAHTAAYNAHQWTRDDGPHGEKQLAHRRKLCRKNLARFDHFTAAIDMLGWGYQDDAGTVTWTKEARAWLRKTA